MYPCFVYKEGYCGYVRSVLYVYIYITSIFQCVYILIYVYVLIAHKNVYFAPFVTDIHVCVRVACGTVCGVYML